MTIFSDSEEDGYIVVETVGAFIPFLLLVVSILSLVSISAVQARIHFALTQAANTLSMYSYVLEVMELANDLTTLDNKAYGLERDISSVKGNITAMLGGLNSNADISGTISSGLEAGSEMYAMAEEAAHDPKAALQKLMNYGVNELRNTMFEELARPLIGRYLTNGSQTGDEYLIGSGVVNTNSTSIGLKALEFHGVRNEGLEGSVMIDRNGNVRLVVEYEIEYTFGGLPLPFKPTLQITQIVVTKAWLNGSGKGYW